MVPYESTTEEALFEWWYHRISSTVSKVRTVLSKHVIEFAMFSLSDPGK